MSSKRGRYRSLGSDARIHRHLFEGAHDVLLRYFREPIAGVTRFCWFWDGKTIMMLKKAGDRRVKSWSRGRTSKNRFRRDARCDAAVP